MELVQIKINTNPSWSSTGPSFCSTGPSWGTTGPKENRKRVFVCFLQILRGFNSTKINTNARSMLVANLSDHASSLKSLWPTC